jgi:hypothetical protein
MAKAKGKATKDMRRSKQRANGPELSDAELEKAVGGTGGGQPLNLEEKMQHENRQYTAVSNIMKTKHDTVKNSISNVR